MQLPKEDAQAMRQGNVLYAKLQRAQEALQQLLDSDPRFARLKDVAGLDARVREAAVVAVIRANQDNPMLKQLMADLTEMSISFSTFVSGLRGRPAQGILERITSDLPSLDTHLLQVRGGSNWLETALKSALSTKLPDLPRTVLSQLEQMKDIVRSVQESMLTSAGGLSEEEATARRAQRMQKILALAPPPQSEPGEGPAGPLPAPGQTLPDMVRQLPPDTILGLGDDVLQELGVRRPEDLPGLTPPQLQALRLRLYRYRTGL